MTTHRDHWCDGVGTQRHHEAQSREYRIRIAPPEQYPLDTAEIWLCDRCATSMCGAYRLTDMVTFRRVQVYRYGEAPQTEVRRHGVWDWGHKW